MPGPGAANARLLHDHLRVVVVDLATEQRFGGIDQRAAAREHPVNAVARMVPERETDYAALVVGPAVGVIVERLVVLGRPAQKFDLRLVEHAAHQNETVLAILFDFLPAERSFCHVFVPPVL
jgi:hypothetical protein